jgi:PAS domain S-box-containing protein
MWIYDLETLSFLEVNDAAVTHYGYERGEFLSMTIADIHLADDRPALLQNITPVSDHTVNKAGVWTHRKKSGSMIEIEITSHVLNYKGRRAELVVACDITGRKQAEKAMREAEEKYRSIFENAVEGIYQTTPEGEFLAINPAAARTLGFASPEQIMEEPRATRRYGYVDPKRLGDFMRLVEEHDIVNGFESEVYRPDGSRVWVSENVRTVRGSSGEILHFEGTLEDVTERKLAEAEVQRSQKRLRDIIDGVGPSIFVGLMTPQGILIECNRPSLAAAGLRPEDVLGQPFEKTHWWAGLPEAQQQLREAIARAVRGEASRYDVQVRGSGNDLIDVDFSLQPLRDETGEVVFLVPSASVITERKEAESALDESRRFAESIAENSTSIIYLFDLETRRNAYTNRSAAEILGYSSAQILEMGDSFLPTIIYPEDLPRLTEIHAQLAAAPDGRIFEYEYRVKHASGDWHWLWVRETAFSRRPDGAVWQIMGTAQDITDRKKTERALGESEERFRLVARATNDAIWDWDITANTISFSESLGTLFGYRAGEFESTLAFWINSIHPEDHDEVMASVQAFFASREEVWTGEYRFRCADGAYAFVYDRGYVLRNAEGKPLRMVGSMMNITERKRAESELRAAKVGAEAASLAKSEFLANMSHEIRTPMNGIIGMSDLLLDTPLSRQQREFTETIQISGEALLTIVNDILDFSKIEAGQLELEIGNIDLAQVVRGSLDLLKETAKSKGLELHALVDPGTPTELRGDGGRLRQVLINLIGNALKFTSNGGVKVHISVDRQTKEKASLRFRITDTGIGISPETQARLFQAFTQADGSMTRRYGGTGLGLAISKELVEKMHGRIGVESSLGAGATFWFTVEFPKQPKAVAQVASQETKDIILRRPRSETETASEPIRSQRVLIAEDNPVNQRVALAQLRKLGYSSDAVVNGFEVLEALSRIPYDIILMDCQMPELDGYETTRRLRKRSGPQPYVIAMTANAMQGDRELCLATGMDGYIGKPMRIADLKAALNEASGDAARQNRDGPAQHPPLAWTRDSTGVVGLLDPKQSESEFHQPRLFVGQQESGL